MIAESLSIQRVENGWIVTLYCAGSSVTLVAVSAERVLDIVSDLDWQSPRPLPPGDGVPTPVLGAPR